MKDVNATTYNMLQASLEMLRKLTSVTNSSLSHNDLIEGRYNRYSMDEVENHLNSHHGMKKNHTIRIDIEVVATNRDDAIRRAIDEIKCGSIVEVEHTDNRFNDSEVVVLNDIGIANFEYQGD